MQYILLQCTKNVLYKIRKPRAWQCSAFSPPDQQRGG